MRNLAFSKHGSDLDDSAAYPRTLLNVFTAGREQAHLFMLHREQILAEVGLYFLGAQTPIAVRRSAAKQLFNALDNDGSLRAWEHTHKCQNTRPWDGPMPPFDVGTNGAMFRLSAYENSRKDLTREFEHRMPAMITFVNDWLCIHKPEKRHRCTLTAKTYFLQEAEGLSRQAPLAILSLLLQPLLRLLRRDHPSPASRQASLAAVTAMATLADVCPHH